MLNGFRRFMYGRYGLDALGIFLLVFSFALSLTLRFQNNALLYLISYLPLGLYLFRMLSRNLQRRAAENRKFLEITRPLTGWFRGLSARMRTRGQYRYYQCPGCRQKVRVPRGRGRMIITCPVCRQEFERKT